MSLIKRHKGLAIVGSLSLVLIVIVFILSARMIFSTGETEYGQRLNGLVKIESSLKESIIKETKENSAVEDVKIRIQGKIIYTTIMYKKGTKVATAKEIAEKMVKKYSDEVIACYDFSFFIKENVEAKEDGTPGGFIHSGTKHPNIETVSWTK